MPLPIAILLTVAPTISISTLLPESWDFTHLTKPANPRYTAAQASSYDRASDPGAKQDWFANGDNGKYLRTEKVGNRTEFVMADLKGPGAVVRVWSANPTGTLRFYFDGEATPRIVAKTGDLLDGKDPRFPAPFAYPAAMGHNLYFPLPYAKSLKVTVDDSDGADRPYGFYYHVNYRTYAPGTEVETYSDASLKAAAGPMRMAAERLNGRVMTAGENRFWNSRIAPRSTATLLEEGNSGTISTFDVQIPFPLKQTLVKMAWSDPAQPHNVLRNLILRVSCDGKKTIEAPLGDFFAVAPGISDFKTLPFEVRGNWMMCRLPMPYGKGIKVTIENVGKEEVPLRMKARVSAGTAPYRLHAQWLAYWGPSQPKADLNFVDLKGEGYFVGTHLHVTNFSPEWWGEGDEKIYVDGESFPSTFGTGTEDYYGYAWGASILYARPYHAQTRVDGPGSFGHSSEERFHILDPIPYTKSIKFDMERWHWADCMSGWARTSYWYAKPGGTGPVAVNQKLLTVQEVKPPKPVKGAIEGEDLKIVTVTGGKTQNQKDFWQTSNLGQLWWTEPNAGDQLTLEVPVKKAGTYEVFAHFCLAPDYGIHQLSLNGQDLGTHDFYNNGLIWKRISLGSVKLPKGNVKLIATCKGANAAAKPGAMFGLDYLELVPKRG